MNLEAGVNLGTLIVTLAGVLITGGVAWGALLQRVKTLEKEVEALSGFAERLARIEEQTKQANAALGQITGSWLFREPPSHTAINPREDPPRRGRNG